MNKKILVTGVTGNVGNDVLKRLLLANYPVKAGVRSLEKSKNNFDDDTELVLFDFEDPSTYDGALRNTNKLFLMRPPAISDVKAYIYPVIDAAKSAGVKHIVFLSLMGIEKNPIPPHYKVEKYIEASGIPYTFLRPSFFMQNLNNNHCYNIKERSEIYIPAGKAKISFIDTRDIGEVGAKVLMEDGHQNKAYTLTGSEALDYYKVADIFTSVLGRRITYSNPSLLSFRRTMIKRGIKKEFANVMVGLYLTTRMGIAQKVTHDLEILLGRKPISVQKYIEDYANYWQ